MLFAMTVDNTHPMADNKGHKFHKWLLNNYAINTKVPGIYRDTWRYLGAFSSKRKVFSVSEVGTSMLSPGNTTHFKGNFNSRELLPFAYPNPLYLPTPIPYYLRVERL